MILEFAYYGDIFNEAREQIIDDRLVASYATQVAQGLIHIHQSKCIHRDIKLENIYLTHTGEIKIGDFGWATHSLVDRAEKVVGTINYCAPGTK